ncbi:MAG: [LysW]-aminoadipate/[LysW]-glutamate kinase [Nitrososphaerota archaeon]|nr:[LysW]-aminoadipate/[LysW]-glutamate kinase [Aigarchaeota archaeon]MDW8076244.1 [LysW]-aminoadipate/[LysW]-glutamate kinase [Nitrososphaerota archaeon]
MIVVKAGGRALMQNRNKILDSIASRANMGIIFVHGGGDVVSEYSKRMGIEPKFVTSPQGIRSRYTDENEIDVYNMVMSGKLNKEIVSYLGRQGVKAVGISGVDAGMLRAERKKKIVVVDERGRKRIIDGGYTGTIVSVNVELPRILVEQGYVVVLSPVAIGTEGELLNVDGDQAAAAIARALRAEVLLILTDVEGLILDGQLVREITPREARELLPKIGAGMNRKVMLAAETVEAGVERCIICSGLTEEPLSALEHEYGTVITMRGF